MFLKYLLPPNSCNLLQKFIKENEAFRKSLFVFAILPRQDSNPVCVAWAFEPHMEPLTKTIEVVILLSSGKLKAELKTTKPSLKVIESIVSRIHHGALSKGLRGK